MASGIAEVAKLLLETRDGVLYEPRVLWAVAGRQASGGIGPIPPATVLFKLPAAEFYNGENQPITLQHLCLAPINVRQHESYARMLELAEVSLRVPERQHYTDDFIPLSSWGQRRVWGPDAKVTESTAPAPDLYRSSDLFNVCRWDFTHTMVIPRQGTLEISVAPMDGREVPHERTRVRNIPVNIGVNEAAPVPGAFYQGNARVASRLSELIDEGGPCPRFYPNWAPAGGDGPTLPGGIQWPIAGQFNARAFDRQNSAASGNGHVSGFQVHIDQLTYDDVYSGNESAGLRPVSLATSLATRARMVNGGTGRDWWRPGAPLALVCPTRTPAQVYELPVPITLTPGDGVEIELRLPAYSLPEEDIAVGEFVIGVSLCGFAMVEN